MKIERLLSTVLLLVISQVAFGQAAKEVVVLDGQLAVINGPDRPVSVLLEGTINPLPVRDADASSEEPFMVRGSGTYCIQCGGFIFKWGAPSGRQIKLKGISISTSATPPPSGFEFVVLEALSDPEAGGQIQGVQVLNLSPSQFVTQEFDHLPPVFFVAAQCNGVDSTGACQFTLWGTYVLLGQQ